ncbi:methyltransferase [Thermomonospora curvata]|uniref:O-methyltransferase family 2 n=1 Tax=Thermomonospora curvata (strain ATCC 19995 / DSM 43183 / JCM 3096 / KCTC 9072 / NBRC 15933 / NCIMB 10081 / Henssen B9) TaxID=471852 RepID=D1A695_THECD|nr:methyltransferase [Thermomonospora curvata]ACZ00194.1 O-methyltransferase family 2 [Thermomonospora curvata DSM 43183]
MSDSPSPTADPNARIWELIRGWWRFCALNAWVELGCPDRLAGGPLTAEQLAERCGAHAPSMERLLRAMASLGVVTADTERGTYALTEVGALLRSDVPDSMHPGVAVMGEEMSWTLMGRLADTVRTGRSPVADSHGSLYGYYATRPELEKQFAAYMTARSRSFARGLLDAYDFSGVQTMVDVGGGVGTIIADVLSAYPGIKGTLLDLPSVTEAAHAYLASQGVADRCEVVAGSFLESVPAKADRYLLASILHNWPDETALQILRTVREAMGEHSRVLLLDILLPDVPDRPHLGYDMDIRMMALFGEGHERTRDAYLGLLEEGGFKPLRTIELASGPTLVEAAAAG